MGVQGGNILFIGRPEEREKSIAEAAGGTELLSIHHTVSTIGIGMYIDEARASGKDVLIMDIDEFRRDVLERMFEEMKKGGIRYLAYCGVCPCDCDCEVDFVKRCRCTRRQIASYYERLTGMDEYFRIVQLSEPYPGFTPVFNRQMTKEDSNGG